MSARLVGERDAASEQRCGIGHLGGPGQEMAIRHSRELGRREDTRAGSALARTPPEELVPMPSSLACPRCLRGGQDHEVEEAPRMDDEVTLTMSVPNCQCHSAQVVLGHAGAGGNMRRCRSSESAGDGGRLHVKSFPSVTAVRWASGVRRGMIVSGRYFGWRPALQDILVRGVSCNHKRRSAKIEE